VSVAGNSDAYLELAIQRSPRNPPAAWFWQPVDDILGRMLHVRVGGSFIWPPPLARRGEEVKRLVLVAGGVGIKLVLSRSCGLFLHLTRCANSPLISILSHLAASEQMPLKVTILYSTHPGKQSDGSDILFLTRLCRIAKKFEDGQQVELQLYLTGSSECLNKIPVEVRNRRISHEDLDSAVGQSSQRSATVCYICGPQKMTDEFVEYVQDLEGMDLQNVLCEKWW